MKRRIGIATNNFKLSYQVIKELKRRGIDYAMIAPGAKIPKGIDVVMTTKEEKDLVKFKRKAIIDEGDVEGSVEKAILMCENCLEFSTIIIGIDPGESPGMAIIGDGRVIRAMHLRSPEDVGEEVERALKIYQAKKYLIKVGDSGGVFRDRVLRVVSGFGIEVEIVNEKNTSGRIRKYSDVHAAIKIAMKSGEPYVSKNFKRKVPKGLIRDVQKKSRMLSNGKITIPEWLAKKVAMGDIDLETAIRMAERGLK